MSFVNKDKIEFYEYGMKSQFLLYYYNNAVKFNKDFIDDDDYFIFAFECESPNIYTPGI